MKENEVKIKFTSSEQLKASSHSYIKYRLLYGDNQQVFTGHFDISEDRQEFVHTVPGNCELKSVSLSLKQKKLFKFRDVLDVQNFDL